MIFRVILSNLTKLYLLLDRSFDALHNSNMKLSSIFPYKPISLSEPEVIRRYYKYESIYRNIITPFFSQFQSEEFELLFFSIMIYEDYNRPAFLRQCERILLWLSKMCHITRPMTLGIMQVRTDSIISDEESVRIAAQRLFDHIKTTGYFRNSYEYTINRFIFEYNPSQLYTDQVNKLMSILKSQVYCITKQAA